MKKKTIWGLLLTSVMCLSLSGCLTRKPSEIVVMHPGVGIQILENRKVKGRTLKSGTLVEVDIGGWAAMPYDHWLIVKARLKKTSNVKVEE